MLKWFKSYKHLFFLQFIWHYIDVVGLGVTFWRTAGIALSVDDQRPGRSTVYMYCTHASLPAALAVSVLLRSTRGGSHLGPERDLHTITTT